MFQVFLGIGSNLGDRNKHIAQALSALNNGNFTIIDSSSIYETEPVGFTDQPKFLNMVIRAQTLLEPLACLNFLKKIETGQGRTRPFKNSPRPIDLDILFYDSIVYNSKELVIPHPELAKRAFVLVPLSEIAPDFCHPVLKQPIKELMLLTDATGVKRWNPA